MDTKKEELGVRSVRILDLGVGCISGMSNNKIISKVIRGRV